MEMNPTPARADLPTFTFRGFTLRPARMADYSLAANWTMADPDHRDTTNPVFWLEQCDRMRSFLLVDKSMRPIFFFKIEKLPIAASEPVRSVEVHIQFAPNDQHGARLRTIQGMLIGFDWLKKILSSSGFHAVYFTSKSPRLIQFCKKGLGFAETEVEGRMKSEI